MSAIDDAPLAIPALAQAVASRLEEISRDMSATDQYVGSLDDEYQERMERGEKVTKWADAAINDPETVSDILFDHGREFGYDVARLMRNVSALRMGERIAYQAVCEALTSIEGRLHAIAVKMAPED